MTKIKNNPIMKGASGMLAGTVVYRQYQGKTIMSNRPKKRPIMTPHQESIKSKFLQAVQFAKKVMADPQLKAQYQPGRDGEFTSSYIAALADYLRRLKAGETPLSDHDNRSEENTAPSASHDNEIKPDSKEESTHSSVVVNHLYMKRPLASYIIASWRSLSRPLQHVLNYNTYPFKEKRRIADLFLT